MGGSGGFLFPSCCYQGQDRLLDTCSIWRGWTFWNGPSGMEIWNGNDASRGFRKNREEHGCWSAISIVRGGRCGCHFI